MTDQVCAWSERDDPYLTELRTALDAYQFQFGTYVLSLIPARLALFETEELPARRLLVRRD